MSDTRIDIMRHGEPQGGRCYRGSTIDDELSDKGWQQMWNAIPDTPPWQHIITSPLSRCYHFANALAGSLDIKVTMEDQFKEIGFGSWEGRTPEDIQQNEGDALQNFLRDPINHRPPGAEPLDDFAERVWQAYEGYANKYQGQHILIIAHAGVIRAITSKVLGMELNQVYSRLRAEYAAIAHTKITEANGPIMVLE